MTNLPDRYFELGKIATGGFATIYKAIDLESGRVVALKDTVYNVSSRSATRAMRREIAILRNIQHCNIVRCYDIQRATEESRYFIAMELCNSDLHDFIRAFRHRRRRIPEPMVLKMIRDISSALAFLHNPINFTTIDSLGADDDAIRVIIHRDIKPGNIMLAEDGCFKLCDFNLSREININSGAASNTGTIAYMAPELLSGQKYDEKVDLWSLGCTIHEMCMYYSPFHNQSMAQALSNILAGRYDNICSYYSEELRSLVKMLLSINPLDRPSASELLGHPLLIDARKNRPEPLASSHSNMDKGTSSGKRPSTPNKGGSNLEQKPQAARAVAPERDAGSSGTRQSPYMKHLLQSPGHRHANPAIDLERKAERTQTPGRVFKQIKYSLVGNDRQVEDMRLDDLTRNSKKTSSNSSKQEPDRGEKDDSGKTKTDDQIPYKLHHNAYQVNSYPMIAHGGGISNSPRRQGTLGTNSTGPGKIHYGQHGNYGAEAVPPHVTAQDRTYAPTVTASNINPAANQPNQTDLLTSSAGRRSTDLAMRRSQSSTQPQAEAAQTTGETGLIIAVTQNNKKGVMLNIKQAGQYNSSGMTALQLAAHHNYYSIIPLILEKEGRMSMIRAYKFRGTRYQGLTALHIAAINGYVESVSVLATTEAKQADALNSQTALMFCSIYNNIECARILVTYERGCRDANGMTALIHAIENENIEHVRLLVHLENTIEDNGGKIPLTYAVAKGSTDMIRILLPLHNKADVAKSLTIVRQQKLLADKKIDELERYMRKYV